MAVTAMYDYNWPSRSAAELYGDNQLVHIWWKGNPFYVSAATFPLPQEMPFGALMGLAKDFFSADPDFDPDAFDKAQWAVDKQPITPDPEASITANGVGLKSLVSFEI